MADRARFHISNFARKYSLGHYYRNFYNNVRRVDYDYGYDDDYRYDYGNINYT